MTVVIKLYYGYYRKKKIQVSHRVVTRELAELYSLVQGHFCEGQMVPEWSSNFLTHCLAAL